MLTGVDRTCTIKLPPILCESHKTAREGRVLFSAALLRAIHFLSSGSMETLPASGTVAGERIDLRLRVGARESIHDRTDGHADALTALSSWRGGTGRIELSFRCGRHFVGRGSSAESHGLWNPRELGPAGSLSDQYVPELECL